MNKLQIFFVYYIVIIAFYCPVMVAMDCSMIDFGSDQKDGVVDWTSRSTILPPVLTTNTGDFSQSMVGIGKPRDLSTTVFLPNTNKSLVVEKTATEKKEEELFAMNASFFVSSVGLLLQSYKPPIPVGLQFTQQLVERKVRSRGYVLELLKNIPNVIKTEDTKNFLNSIAEHLRSMQKPVNKELVEEWTKKIDAMREACEFVEEVDAVAKEPKIIGEKNNKALGFCLKKIKSKEQRKIDVELEWNNRLLSLDKRQKAILSDTIIILSKEEKNCIEKQRKVRRREFKLKKTLKEQKQNVLTLEKEKNKFGFFIAYAVYLDNVKNNYLPMIKKEGRSIERTLSTIEDAEEILYARALDILNENQINKAPKSILVPLSNPRLDADFAYNAECESENAKYRFDENAQQWIVALEFIAKEIENKPQNALLIKELQKFDPKNNLHNLQEWDLVYAEKVRHYLSLCNKLVQYNTNFTPITEKMQQERGQLRSILDNYCSGTMDIIQEKYAELLLDINKTFSRPMDKKEAGDFIGKLTAYIAERIYALKNQMRNFDITQNVSGKISVLHSLEKQVLVYGTYDAQLNDAFQRIKNKCIHCALDCIKQSFIEKDQDVSYRRIPDFCFGLIEKEDPFVTYKVEGEKLVRVVPEKEQEWRDALLFISEELAQNPTNTLLIKALKDINLKDASIIKGNMDAVALFPVVKGKNCLKVFSQLTKYSSELCFLVKQSVLVNQAIDTLNSLQDRETKSEKELHQYGLALKMVAYEIINNKNTPFKDQINKLRVKIDLKDATTELQTACKIISGFSQSVSIEDLGSRLDMPQTVTETVVFKDNNPADAERRRELQLQVGLIENLTLNIKLSVLTKFFIQNLIAQVNNSFYEPCYKEEKDSLLRVINNHVTIRRRDLDAQIEHILNGATDINQAILQELEQNVNDCNTHDDSVNKATNETRNNNFEKIKRAHVNAANFALLSPSTWYWSTKVKVIADGSAQDGNATSVPTGSVATPSSWDWLSWLNPFAWLCRKA